MLERIRLCPSWCCRPFAVEGRASGRRAQQEALGPDVPRQPHEVADALEAEHRVVDVERHQAAAMGGVGGAGGDERGHRAGLRNPLLENLPVFGLVIVEQRLHIHRLVKLPLGRVNAHLAKQGVQPERPRLIGYNRHNEPPDLRIANQHSHQPHEAHRGGHLRTPRGLEQLPKGGQLRRLQRLGLDHAPG